MPLVKELLSPIGDAVVDIGGILQCPYNLSPLLLIAFTAFEADLEEVVELWIGCGVWE